MADRLPQVRYIDTANEETAFLRQGDASPQLPVPVTLLTQLAERVRRLPRWMLESAGLPYTACSSVTMDRASTPPKLKMIAMKKARSSFEKGWFAYGRSLLPPICKCNPCQQGDAESCTEKGRLRTVGAFFSHIDDLRCPICFEIAWGGLIWQCSNGHILCSPCKSSLRQAPPELQKCPLCRNSNLDGRCIKGEKFLRNALNKTLAVCRHKNCPWSGFTLDVLNHESECFRKPVSCAGIWKCQHGYRGCVWKGPLDTLADHLQKSECFNFIQSYRIAEDKREDGSVDRASHRSGGEDSASSLPALTFQERGGKQEDDLRLVKATSDEEKYLDPDYDVYSGVLEYGQELGESIFSAKILAVLKPVALVQSSWSAHYSWIPTEDEMTQEKIQFVHFLVVYRTNNGEWNFFVRSYLSKLQCEKLKFRLVISAPIFRKEGAASEEESYSEMRLSGIDSPLFMMEAPLNSYKEMGESVLDAAHYISMTDEQIKILHQEALKEAARGDCKFVEKFLLQYRVQVLPKKMKRCWIKKGRRFEGKSVSAWVKRSAC